MLVHVEEMQGIGVLQDAFEALRLGYMRNDPSGDEDLRRALT